MRENKSVARLPYVVYALPAPHGPFFDALLVVRSLEYPLHVDAGRDDAVRIQYAQFHQFFHFGNGHSGGRGHHGIKIARRLAINQVSPPVALPRLDKGEVGSERALQQVTAPVELAHLLAFGDHRTHTRRRIEAGDAGAAGPDALRQCTLRHELQLDFTAECQAFEHFVLAHVASHHFGDLPRLQQASQAELIHARIIAYDREVLRAFASHGVDEVFGNATEPETADHDRRAVGEVGNGGVRIGEDLVHSLSWLPEREWTEIRAGSRGIFAAAVKLAKYLPGMEKHFFNPFVRPVRREPSGFMNCCPTRLPDFLGPARPRLGQNSVLSGLVDHIEYVGFHFVAGMAGERLIREPVDRVEDVIFVGLGIRQLSLRIDLLY